MKYIIMKWSSIMMLLLMLFGCQQKQKLTSENYILPIIPMPNDMMMGAGELEVEKGFKVITEDLPDEVAYNMNQFIKGSFLKLNENNGVKLQFGYTPPSEGEEEIEDAESYQLMINQNGVFITAPTETGLFYGLQSLLQLVEYNKDSLPFIDIKDSPRFAYRGLMIDCSRHFVSLEFLKKQIDMMAYFKLNRFHWHLTDGPGWRLEIKKYPELTQTAAWRTHAKWKDWWNSGRKYMNEGDQDAYGGYYTQDQARELVKYAAERHITVIPEIEMPGHSEEVLAVYPQLSCTGKPYTSSEFCIGNPEVYTFLENVLDEVINVFPSQYIHIGGDEASREHWKKCPKCQALMKKEGYTDEAQLQSYLIHHIEEYLKSKDRKLIGWDEILEGGLAPDATVMSWRGEDGGIKAVRSGHDAIMTPGSHLYFDQYQAIPDKEPEAIGGFLTLEKVYSYDPIPSDISKKDSKHIMGPQANLWAEYIPNEKQYEYMIYPRMLALAEVAWTMPEIKSWPDFKIRANRAIPFLEEKGYNTFTLSKEPFLELKANVDNASTDVILSSELYPVEIRYTLDGTDPDKNSLIYEKPIIVKDSANIVASLFQDGKKVGDATKKQIYYHRAIGKKVDYKTPYSQYYPAGGEDALIDGLPGGPAHGDGLWQGFNRRDIEFIIDMKEIMSIQTIETHFLQNAGAEIWLPATIEFSISSDNDSFKELITYMDTTAEDAEGAIKKDFKWTGDSTGRYIKVKATGKRPGWLFIDEVIVW